MSPVDITETRLDESAPVPVLRIQQVSRAFGPIQALRAVTFDIARGEIVGLVGDNGAGKSTLVKILSGVLRPDSGEIYLNGQRALFDGPHDARLNGIETVYQDLALVEAFDVASNFFLGRELYHGGLLRPLRVARTAEMRRQSRDAVRALGLTIPGLFASPIGRMSGGQRQAVAMARAAFWRGQLLLLDEPTAALGVRESREVLRVIDGLAHNQGLSVLLVSHNMEHISELCERVVVLRQGRAVAILPGPHPDPREIVGYITGAHAAQPGLTPPTEPAGSGETLRS